MRKILMIGEDFAFLARCAALLVRAEASITCCDCSEVPALSGKENFALVVLCHTLPAERLLSVADQVHLRWPQAKLIQIQRNGTETPTLALQSYVTAPAEPRALLRTVLNLLGPQNIAAQTKGPMLMRKSA